MPIPEAYRPQRKTPRWFIFGIAGGLLVLGYLWYRHNQNAQANSSGGGGAIPSNSATAPTLDSTGYLSNVTDTSNNLPWEDTWPYNQLALPYNYSGSNADQVADNTNYLLPNQPDYVGTQATPYYYG